MPKARYVADIVTSKDAFSIGFFAETPEELETRISGIERSLSVHHGESALIVHPVIVGSFEDDYFKEDDK